MTAPHFGAPQYNPYAPIRPVRPPLTPRARTGALVAGAVATLMVSIGGAFIAIPLVLLVIGLIVATVVTAFGGEVAAVLEEIQRFVPTGLLIGVAVALILVGAALVVGALFLSRGILRSRGLDKAWPITWAGLGIAIVAGWASSGVLSIPLQLSGTAFSAGGWGELESAISIITSLAGLVITAAVGALSWWWMAHVMRPAGAAPAEETGAPSAPVAPAA